MKRFFLPLLLALAATASARAQAPPSLVWITNSSVKLEQIITLCAIAIALTIWLCGAGPAFSQSLPVFSVNLNTNGKLHLVWPAPAVDSILQEASSLSNAGAWQASALSITTSGCNCQVLAPATGAANFYRLASANPPTVGIYLGAPTLLLASNQFGMTDVPDITDEMPRHQRAADFGWFCRQSLDRFFAAAQSLPQLTADAIWQAHEKLFAPP